MSIAKKIGLALLALIIVIQFIRPEKNISGQVITENDISKRYAIPLDVHEILIKKCYDCHSNHTYYPWYSAIQPVAGFMAHHINEGKRELNFAVFKTLPEERALHKLEELEEVVSAGSMPINSYLWLHPKTKITVEDKEAITRWLETVIE